MARNVLVTGASRGIGAAIAIAFAKDGCNVALNYRKNYEQAQELAEIIKNTYEVCAVAVQADVSDSAQVEAMLKACRRELPGGKIDVLINNAGFAQQKLFTEITGDDWQKMLGTNLTGVFNCCRAVLPDMIKEKSGRIVNISSIWGQVGASCEVHYSAAKAGVIGLTKALAKETAPSGVTVNCVAPGAVATDMLSGFSERDLSDFCDSVPMGRLGTPREIAAAVVFLASKNASYITGQVFGVNGGLEV